MRAAHYVHFYVLVAHFVAFAVEMYQIYFMEMTLYGSKNVGVTCSVNKVVSLITCKCNYWYLI